MYALLETFDFELLQMNQVTEEKNRKEKALKRLQKDLSVIKDPLQLQSAQSLIDQINLEVKSLNERIAAFNKQAAEAISEISPQLKLQVTSQIQLKLSFLGVTANAEKAKLLSSNAPNDLSAGLARLVAKAVNQGQFGYRNVTNEAGYSKQQRDWVSLYRAIRPDVSVSVLTTNVIYARSTALTAKNEQPNAHSYFIGNDSIISGPRLFLAVNGGSAGKCGNTNTYNVTIEYAFLGANMVQTSVSGALSMPIYFEADVSFVQPGFEGSVSCDFRNGFSVKGRSDVKDGAVISDGDVYNKINYSAIVNGSCNYQIVKGDENSAAYFTIKSIYENYMNLKMQRAIKSPAEMDRYRDYVNAELAHHASQSQKTNFDSGHWVLG